MKRETIIDVLKKSKEYVETPIYISDDKTRKYRIRKACQTKRIWLKLGLPKEPNKNQIDNKDSMFVLFEEA